MKRFLWLLMSAFSLAFGETKSELHLTITQGGLLSTKIISQVLGSIGFKTDVHHFSSVDTIVEMDLTLNGKKSFDSKSFIEVLREHQIMGQTGQLKNKKWVIALDASQAFWNLPAISEEEGAQLEHTPLPSWFVVHKALGISVEAPYGNKWYPEIAVFDSNMQVLESFREFKSTDRMTFKLPQYAVYLKVSNANGMKMLKEGMWIESTNDEQR